MATQILRRIDGWRFETPMALALAAAAGFAAMAMPHAMVARVPVAGDFGRIGHVALAAAAALMLGALGYIAMRRPAKRSVADEADDAEDVYTPVSGPIADVVADGPMRLRRADRHPDAPPRAPIRASRDLGEPFMAVGTPSEPAPVEAESEPLVAKPEAVVEPEPIDVVAPAPVEPDAMLLDDDLAVHDAEPVAEPVAESIVESAPAVAVADGAPGIGNPVVALASRAFTSRREDTSLEAMIERLSSRMQRHSEPVGQPFGLTQGRKPALRDALEELNRLAGRRG